MRSVGIALLVAVLMMNAMSRYPRNRTALQRERAADCEEIFNRLRHMVTPVHQQPMITHADAAVDGQHVQHDGHNQVGPTEKEQRGNRTEMEDHHEDKRDPDKPGLVLRAAHKDFIPNSRSRSRRLEPALRFPDRRPSVC